MKRIAAIFCLAALLAPLSAEEPIQKTLGGGIFIDLYPILNASARLPVDQGSIDDADISSDELSRFSDRPSLVTFGLSFSVAKLQAVIQYEYQQDIWSQAWKHSFYNLPDSPDSWFSASQVGSFFPQLAYAEWKGSWLRFSGGRRKLHAGPGEYTLDLSSANPFYDHLAFGLQAPLAGGQLGWDYALVFSQRYTRETVEIPPKYFVMHRASWSNERLSFGISNYNLIAGADPDFQDLSPFVFYHHIFGNDQNVMMGADATWRFQDTASAYLQIVIDEVRETKGKPSNPTALGILLGAEWRILEGPGYERLAFRESEHAYYLNGQPEPARLSARMEATLTSTYLYSRVSSSPDEAFTARYVITNSWGHHPWHTEVNPLFAYPMLPDCFLFRTAVDWRLPLVESRFSADFRLRGSHSKNIIYTAADQQDGVPWFWPSAPVTPELALSASSNLYPDKYSIVSVSLGCVISSDPFDYACSIGYGRRFGVGKTPSRK